MTHTRTPLITIAFPIYNGESRNLSEVFDSMISQTYKNFELIISDNASTDRTSEICEDYSSKDSRIKYFKHGVNIGASRNFFRLLELAKGEFLVWIASDDRHEATFLEECLEPHLKDASTILT